MRFRLLALALLAGCASGCAGTIVSRSRTGNPIGWPLFDAVATDYRIASDDPPRRSDALFRLLFALSTPVDLVLDVVLLPIDIVAGVCGGERSTQTPPANAADK